MMSAPQDATTFEGRLSHNCSASIWGRFRFLKQCAWTSWTTAEPKRDLGRPMRLRWRCGCSSCSQSARRLGSRGGQEVGRPIFVLGLGQVGLVSCLASCRLVAQLGRLISLGLLERLALELRTLHSISQHPPPWASRSPRRFSPEAFWVERQRLSDHIISLERTNASVSGRPSGRQAELGWGHVDASSI